MAADQNKQTGKTGASSGTGGSAATGKQTGGQRVSGEQIFATTEQENQGQESFATTGQGGAASGSTGSTSGTGQGGSADQMASQVGEVLRGNTTGVSGSVKDVARGAYSQAGEVASQALGQVQEKATTTLDEQKRTLAQGLTSVATSIRQMGDTLRQSDQQAGVVAVTAQYGDTLAHQVEYLSDYLERKDVGEIARDVGQFARRNPSLFIGGAFVLGLLGARFLKSSSPNQALMRTSGNTGANGGDDFQTRMNSTTTAGGVTPVVDAGTTTTSSTVPTAGAGAPETGTTGTTTGTTGGSTTPGTVG
jgi:hypothetical protein